MARMDAFSAQIVKFVREMPDEALLELVKQKLGVSGRGPAPVLPKPLQAPGTGRPAKRSTAARVHVRGASSPDTPREGARTGDKGVPAARARRPAPPSAERQGLLDEVERVVKANPGVSASDVARLGSIPQTRAAAALKELKLAKRIFQGGDRRFARYAADSKTAEQASAAARKTAKGPIVGSRKSAARPRKRGRPAASTAGA